MTLLWQHSCLSFICPTGQIKVSSALVTIPENLVRYARKVLSPHSNKNLCLQYFQPSGHVVKKESSRQWKHCLTVVWQEKSRVLSHKMYMILSKYCKLPYFHMSFISRIWGCWLICRDENSQCLMFYYIKLYTCKCFTVKNNECSKAQVHKY